MENKNDGKKLRKAKSVKKINDNILDESTSKKKKKKGKRGWKIFKICLFIGIALAIVATGVVLGVVTGIVDKTESISPEELKNLEQTSFVYDKDGKQIGSFSDSENRVLVKYKDIPKYLVDAVVSIEDERFFEHKGVDFKRTVAAVATYVFNGGESTFGGSTITQQLIKNISDDKEKSWVRKIREWYRAFNIETVLTKEEILTSYVNTIYLGDGCYGIQAASQNYFGKPISNISIAQSAILAAIIQSPEATNPYRSDEAKEKLLSRQKIVLDKMLELGKINNEEYDAAVAEEIKFERASDDTTSDEVQSYFVDAVFESVLEDLMTEKDINEATATVLLYTGGYKIYTTMDPKVQSVIDKAYANERLFYRNPDKSYMQSAMVVIDQSTGEVVGLIGGADEKTGARSFNRATDAKRQPGSCMKPIVAYGPAFEKGVLSPGAGLDDSQLTIGNWTIKEWYGYYNGYVTARNAIAQSMNVPAVRALQKVGVEYGYNFAKSLGLYNLKESDKSLPMALGGISGVSVMEMANAYATFANGGMYLEPKLYTLVTDSEGNEILNNNRSNAKMVMKDSTAFMITSCLQTVVTNGTATGYVKMSTPGIDVVGKTGQTNDDIDQWFCGYTPYYTIACWNGYDDSRTIGTRKIGSYPYTSVYLFNEVMNGICAGKKPATFKKPDTVVTAELCKTSGLVGTDACKKDQRGSQIGSDLVAKRSIPTDTCTIHKIAKVCKITRKLAGENCAEVEESSFITRDYKPNEKPRDWNYMLPTEICNTCKKVEEVPEINIDNEVDIYTTVESTGNTSNENE